MRSGMEHVKELFIYFLAAMAMFSLLCAVYETMNQRLGSAGVLSAIPSFFRLTRRSASTLYFEL